MRFRHKGLRALAEQDRANLVPGELALRLRRILTAQGEARRPGDLATRRG